jgi:hypothetical protein
MNRRPVNKFSDCPFKSCDALTLRFLKVNSASPSAQAGEKLGLGLANGTVSSLIFRLRLAPQTN